MSDDLFYLPVKIGDVVIKDQLIAELDKIDYELQLEQAGASSSSVRAQTRNAKANYERIQALYENQGASRQDLSSSRAAYESARANSGAAAKQVEQARLQLSYTELRAPVDGTVKRILVEKNENVAAGTPVIILTSGAKMKVTVAIPESIISLIKEGSTVEVRFDAIPDKVFMATVSEVGTTSATGATFPVTALLKETDPSVLPGMAVEIDFVFGNEDDRVRFFVPPHCVGEDHLDRFIFLLETTKENLGIVHKTPVVIGELTDEGLEIVEGVKEGDLIVNAGITRIQDGLVVKVPTLTVE